MRMSKVRPVHVTFVQFEDDEALSHAAKELKKRGIPLLDAYTPYPIHGLDEVMGWKRSRLPVVCFIAAAVGCVSSMWFQVWTSAQDWPINVGGKPFVSIPAFIPVTFEVTVLLGGLVTVAAFLWRSRLYPGKCSRVVDRNITSDGFWLAVAPTMAETDPVALEGMLRGLGGSKMQSQERVV